MRRIVSGAVLIGLAVWWFLGFIGNLETAKSLFDNRGTVMRVLGGILTSQWLPLALFLLGVAALIWIYAASPSPGKTRDKNIPVDKFFTTEGPKLIGDIEEIIHGETPDGPHPTVTLQVRIRNTGTASIVDQYELRVTMPDGRVIAAIPMLIPERQEMRFKDGRTRVIRSEDAIYEKTSTPITNGEQVRGWIHFQVNGATREELLRDESFLTLLFTDVAGHTYAVTAPIRGTGPGIDVYRPGLLKPEWKKTRLPPRKTVE